LDMPYFVEKTWLNTTRNLYQVLIIGIS
jgi:hypothetical protein